MALHVTLAHGSTPEAVTRHALMTLADQFLLDGRGLVNRVAVLPDIRRLPKPFAGRL